MFGSRISLAKRMFLGKASISVFKSLDRRLFEDWTYLCYYLSRFSVLVSYSACDWEKDFEALHFLDNAYYVK